jgi:nicotinate-nucleotide pyrophosphorylase (carboxylating)
MIDNLTLDPLIDRVLEEDWGTGDITTLCTVSADREISGRLIAKEAGVVCGLGVVERVFHKLDATIVFAPAVHDGQAVEVGTVLARVSGNARAILVGERTALNFLQRLSGVASRTAQAVAAVAGTGARITDTRKTTPGLRVLEKYAVRCGGGSNHRFNLSDGVLIKDNHIAAAGGITAAVKAARANAPHTLKIEVEVEDFDMLEEALAVGADIIMLDNMDLEHMAEAVRRVAGRALVEASGNMGDKDLREVALTGVNLISIGALTHTVRAMDISLRFDKM